jgi:hypothetical protein
MGKKVFLSYVDEDKITAHKLDESLSAGGLDICYWQDRKQWGKQYFEIEAPLFIQCVPHTLYIAAWTDTSPERDL